MSPPEVVQKQEHKIVKHNPGAYMVLVMETWTEKAPFSDSFTVEERWDYLDIKRTCQIRYLIRNKWKKSTFFAGSIRKASIKAAEDAAENFMKTLNHFDIETTIKSDL